MRNGRRIQRFAQGSHTVAQYAAVQPPSLAMFTAIPRELKRSLKTHGRNSKELSLFSGEIGLSMRILSNFIGWMRHHNEKRDAARRAASSGPMKRAP